MAKENNFDFLRFSLALLVVIAHSYPLSGSAVSEQWIYQITNVQLEFSNIGLNGFFIISGYLIYQSLERSNGFLDYYWKRFLRLFPGLFAVLLLCLLLAPFVYEGATPFLSNHQVYSYLPKNISLYNLQYTIRGIFTDNPYPSVINGSLWTICYEFSLYILLSTLIVIRKNIKIVQVLLFLSFLVLFAGYNLFPGEVGGITFFSMNGTDFLNLGTFFVSGSLLASLRIEKADYQNQLICGVGIIIILSLYFGFYNSIKHIVFSLLILLIGLRPIRFITTFGKMEYSFYGIYIYGFPVQQTIMHFFNFSCISLLISSVMVSIILGYLSWHLIEKKSLQYKNLVVLPCNKEVVIEKIPHNK